MNNKQLEHHEVENNRIKYPISILLADVELPVNVGSIFRIADGLGVKELFLCGKTVTPAEKKVKKSSRSTEKYVAYQYFEDALELVKDLQNSGHCVVALELTSKSEEISQINLFDFSDEIVFVVGNERKGIDEKILNAVDKTVHISMAGINSSLNVATATALAVYEAKRQFGRDS